jgi:hypothetical protein
MEAMMRLTIILLFTLLMIIPGMLRPEVAATFTDFHYPKNVVIDDDQIIVSDYPSIHILSLKDYRVLKTFGREGSGPGENWIDKVIVDNKERGLLLRVGPDYIMVNSYLWFSYFTREGQFVKTLRLKNFNHGARFWPLGKNYVAVKPIQEGKRVYITVALFDQKLEVLKEIYRTQNWRQGDDDNLNFFARATQSVIFNVYDNKIFVVKGGDQEFLMNVYDHEGNKLYTITRESEKIKIPQTYIKDVYDWFRIKFQLGLEWNIRNTKFPEYFPALRDFQVEDNKIYVFTYKREGNKNEVIVLDLKGKLLKKEMIPVYERNPEGFHAYSFHKGAFYQFVEQEESEEWELHITKIK